MMTPVVVLPRGEAARILSRVDWGEAVRRRVVQQALSDALATTWRRRADMFEWAVSSAADYRGQLTTLSDTPERVREIAERDRAIAERDRRLTAQAEACRHHAQLLELGLLDDPEAVT